MTAARDVRASLHRARAAVNEAELGLRSLEDGAEAAPTGEAAVSLYRERAHLVAHLARLYPAHWSEPDADDADRDYALVCVHTPAGQATWHIAPGDVGLFPEMETRPGHWDGHTTTEKYDRIDMIGARVIMAARLAEYAQGPQLADVTCPVPDEPSGPPVAPTLGDAMRAGAAVVDAVDGVELTNFFRRGDGDEPWSALTNASNAVTVNGKDTTELQQLRAVAEHYGVSPVDRRPDSDGDVSVEVTVTAAGIRLCIWNMFRDPAVAAEARAWVAKAGGTTAVRREPADAEGGMR